MKKSNFGFSFIKNMATFEAITQNFSLSAKSEIWRSDGGI